MERSALYMYTHKEIARLFQEIYEYKISLRNIIKENTGKAEVLERAGLLMMNSFTGILKIFIFFKHLRMAAYQKDKEKSSE